MSALVSISSLAVLKSSPSGRYLSTDAIILFVCSFIILRADDVIILVDLFVFQLLGLVGFGPHEPCFGPLFPQLEPREGFITVLVPQCTVVTG